MKPVVKMFAMVGLLVPSLLLIANLIELESNSCASWTHSLWPYVWPSSLILSAAHPIYEFGLIDWLVMGVAIAMNVALYALIGMIVGLVGSEKSNSRSQ